MTDYDIVFDESKNEIRILGFSDGQELREIPYEDKYRMVYSHLKHKANLTEAKNIINQYGDNDIVNEALVRSAMVLLIRSFTPAKNCRQLDKHDVYKTQTGAENVFDYYKNLRDTYVAHDDNDYTNALLGIIVDQEKKTVLDSLGFCALVQLRDREHAQQLFNLIDCALRYVENKLSNELQRVTSDYAEKSKEDIDTLQLMKYTAP